MGLSLGLLFALILALGVIILLMAGSSLKEHNRKPIATTQPLLPFGYYALYLADAELATKPVLDLPTPLPTIYVRPDRTVQLAALYNYDRKEIVGGRIAAESGSTTTRLNLNAIFREMLKEALQLTANIISWSYIPTRSSTIEYRATTQLDTGELHDFIFTCYPLPASPVGVTPKRGRRTLGYFSQTLQIGLTQYDIIQRYRPGPIEWRPAATVPKEWYPIMTKAISYWNKYLPKDSQLSFQATPWSGSLTDPAVNLIIPIRSVSQYIGIGTSAIDTRVGVYHWSRI